MCSLSLTHIHRELQHREAEAREAVVQEQAKLAEYRERHSKFVSGPVSHFNGELPHIHRCNLGVLCAQCLDPRDMDAVSERVKTVVAKKDGQIKALLTAVAQLKHKLKQTEAFLEQELED